MSGEINLSVLLKSMQPVLCDREYVFCTSNQKLDELIALNPIAFFQEDEGMTLILLRQQADRAALSSICPSYSG